MLTQLKIKRKAVGLNQTALAEAIGVTPGAVSQWESGLTNPTLETLVKIATVLHCTVDDLLTETEPKTLNEEDNA